MKPKTVFTVVAMLLLFVTLVGVFSVAAGPVEDAPSQLSDTPTPRFSTAVAFDVSPALRDLPAAPPVDPPSEEVIEVRPERGPIVQDQGYAGDGALDTSGQSLNGLIIPEPLVNFEGLSNEDNRTIYGVRVNPPDPVGDVGPNHYVEMVNVVFAVYDKVGNRLLGPTAVGSLWQNFPIEDCTDRSGDPIVLYDQLEDRWLLSQFTTRGPIFYNCVAISQTGDPTGAYFRYAFSAGEFFPDYPKYGVWTNSYLLTSRDFGPIGEYGISVYALEKTRMIDGDPNARSVQFFLDSAEVPINLIGDGLLPADIDGTRRPQNNVPAPVVGTQDEEGPYGAPFDALNVYELSVRWRSTPIASLNLVAQLPVAEFDSAFPCAPGSRDCLPQPGIVNPAQFLDILSYRQRPTWRLAYRNFGTHEALVTNQSVEALPAVAGVRWYEIRRAGGQYSVYQQGTFAPNDGVHRWMGSIAMDGDGNIAVGYSVVNGIDVFPGIRYTGRLSGDPLGEMTLGEGVIINGTGSQLTTNSRWGDYTSMNIDPVDDCTFWYVNEYYQITELAAWQTRIASFKLPECELDPED
ncbi:MAG: hypothetical protein L0332_09575 [Chloroflexi bacterium]|nr:hypothetical protein [Chloroflexota bacterium]MCI0577112.1 hypothetical protein [Chloroflexota bacterium]MCI0646845.1 hypothetical protein [Chloroflexota bacterium]MCI0726956.1 hypothetical protein [Chloroflexota bacterium]